MSEKLFLYPVWIRVWHGLNAILCLCLILTGLSLQYSNPEGGLIIRFDIAVNLHNISGITLSLSYVLFVFGNMIKPNGNHYKIKIKGFLIDVFKQFKYYALDVYRGVEPPFPITEDSKFNPLQKFTYVGLMYFFIPIVIITGWILIFPDFFQDHVFGSESTHIFDLFHLITGFVISLFMLIHIYFCTLGSTVLSNFRSIINGWHEVH